MLTIFESITKRLMEAWKSGEPTGYRRQRAGSEHGPARLLPLCHVAHCPALNAFHSDNRERGLRRDIADRIAG
jgi:hypothetical protein